MDERRAAGSMHPVLREFLGSTEDGLQIIERIPEPHDSITKAILGLYRARALRIPFDEALARADSVSQEEYDPNLCLYFIHIWAVVSLLAGRLQQAGTLIRRGESLISGEVLPEIHVNFLIAKSAVLASQGDHVGADRNTDEAVRISASASSSPRHGLILVQRAIWRARRGRGVEVQEDLEYLTANQKPGRRPDANLINLVRFIDHVATGRAEEAAAVLETIDLDAPGPVAKFVAESEPVLQLMRGTWDPATDGVASPEESGTSESSAPWMTSTVMLQRRRPEEALEWARRPAGSELSWAGFPASTLIRAELACGNAAAGRRLIQIKRDKGGPHYLDDLFLARVELLEGNREAAGRHFAAVIRSCDHYRARAMLDFELGLACELSAGDLIDLGRLAAGASELPPPERPSGGPALATRGAARLVGDSGQLAEVRELVRRFAPLDVPVLIVGETGVGKELVAHALHEESLRREQPFLAVNCGAISDSLLESELFGHEKGAFTGAQKSRAGLFEEAGAGTVLLDEIGEISPRLQVALLRVLETGEIRPVGSSRTREIGCRAIAATNADLEERVSAGTFRRDLLYRLRRLEILLPPLRERPEDILPLADHFLSLDRSDARRAVMSEELKSRMLAHAWPGNVRELRYAVERMRLMNSEKLSYDAGDLDVGEVRSARESPGGREGSPRSSPGAVGPRAPAPGVAEVLRAGRGSIRRRERLRELFREHRVLTRSEVVKVMGMAPATATKDLRALCAEGLIEKVEPSRSPRTHYFRLRSS